jgi:hypothetical protein
VFGKGFHDSAKRWRLLFKIGNKWEEADLSTVIWESDTEFEVMTPNFRK